MGCFLFFFWKVSPAFLGSGKPRQPWGPCVLSSPPPGCGPAAVNSDLGWTLASPCWVSSIRVSVQGAYSAVAKSCVALCDPRDCSTSGFPVLHHLLEFCSNSRPLGRWGHPTLSSSVTPFSFCLPSFPASGSFPTSRLIATVERFSKPCDPRDCQQLEWWRLSVFFLSLST